MACLAILSRLLLERTEGITTTLLDSLTVKKKTQRSFKISGTTGPTKIAAHPTALRDLQNFLLYIDRISAYLKTFFRARWFYVLQLLKIVLPLVCTRRQVLAKNSVNIFTQVMYRRCVMNREEVKDK